MNGFSKMLSGLLIIPALAFLFFFAAAAEGALPRAVMRLFEAPIEAWEPVEDKPEFVWAEKLDEGTLSAVVLVPRWAAYEVMQIQNRVDIEFRHIYFHRNDRFWDPRWHYADATGQRPIPFPMHLRRALGLIEQEDSEVFLVAGISSESGEIPEEIMEKITGAVEAGRGLVITGDPGYAGGWPERMFENPDEELADSLRKSAGWEGIPGFMDSEPGRGMYQAGHLTPVVEKEPPELIRAYRFGDGLIFTMNFGVFRPYITHHMDSRKASVVPLSYRYHGLDGAADRAMAFTGKALIVAAGRNFPAAVAVGEFNAGLSCLPVEVQDASAARIRVRVQDDLDRTILLDEMELPLIEGCLRLPRSLSGRMHFVDISVLDGAGNTLDYRSVSLPASGVFPSITGANLGPAAPSRRGLVPAVEVPESGGLSARLDFDSPLPYAGETVWEITDAAGRILAREKTSVSRGAMHAQAVLSLSGPVTVYHRLDAKLIIEGEEVSAYRKNFTVPMEFPVDDFNVIFWGTRGGETLSREKNSILYRAGADALHISGITRFGVDETDEPRMNREFGLVAGSGLRVIPYATRVYGRADEEDRRIPSLFDTGGGSWINRESERLERIARVLYPYSPAAVNLGDENYILRFTTPGGDGEVCRSSEAMEEFRTRLGEKYGNIESLNEAWASGYGDFSEVIPAYLEEAAASDKGYASWIEHRLFMAETFTNVHERFRDVIKARGEDMRVGWEGLFGYGHDERDWRWGYDYEGLCRGLELNAPYAQNWISSELTRSFATRGSLTGKWGNRAADNEEGFTGHPWDSLLAGMNSVWWWHSWGSNYTPFNPNLSLNKMGEWFFSAVSEIKSGPGKLILNSKRGNSGIAVLYSPRDMYAGVAAGKVSPGEPYAGSRNYWEEMTALLRGVKDIGFQYDFISLEDLKNRRAGFPDYRVIFLSYPSCVSEKQSEALEDFVRAGGTLVVNGRAGLLSGAGTVLGSRPLDGLLGIKSPAGIAALKSGAVNVKVVPEAGEFRGAVQEMIFEFESFEASLLEQGIEKAGAVAAAGADGEPALLVNRYGKGAAVLANFSWRQEESVPGELLTRGLGARITNRDRLSVLDGVIRSAGVVPFAEAGLSGGGEPSAVEQIVFSDGDLRYLVLQQDFLLPRLGEQHLEISFFSPVVVYDLRRGERLSGNVAEDAEGTYVRLDYHRIQAAVGRGDPLIFALLPYEVAGLNVSAPPEAVRGESIEVAIDVSVVGSHPGRHVVRMDVYGPGWEMPHREYSVNMDCPGGSGSARVPFALNDRTGLWKLEFRDVASGASVAAEIMLK